MPLHDVGYRPWEGTKSPLATRWLVIASTGVCLAFRSTWLSRTLILTWVPAIVFGVLFFFYEQSLVDRQFQQPIQGILMSSGMSMELVQSYMQDPEGARHLVWSTLLLTFFRYPQAIFMLVVVAMVAPKLIAYDLRNRGYLLYFSRPIQLAGYIAGKICIVATFLALMTTIPALVLYVVGLSLSPDRTVVLLTWDLPIRILIASLCLMIPTASVALACSSITIQTRYAALSWFAVWIVGWVSYSVLRIGELARNAGGGGPPDLMRESDWELLSPFHVLGRVQQYIFGLYPEENNVLPYFIVLISVTLIALTVICWRIRARLRA